MIITKTPLRVSLFGGGTDIPEYYRTAHKGGAVLGFSLDKYVYVTARKLPPFFKHKHRCVWSRIETVISAAEIVNPVYREALITYWDEDADGGVEAHYDSDLPARSGLGSSSAFAVGLIQALTTLSDRTISTEQLANHAIALERIALGEPGGHQDQAWAAFGGFNRIDFYYEDARAQRKITPLNPNHLIDHLLLFYTGQQRQASQIEGMKIERMEQNFEHLHLIRKHVTVAERLLVLTDYEGIGALLNKSWQLKRSLAPGVSYLELDDMYAAARRAGAWGGKLLGAGGGGFLLLCAPVERKDVIRAALSGLIEVPVGIAEHGCTVYELK